MKIEENGDSKDIGIVFMGLRLGGKLGEELTCSGETVVAETIDLLRQLVLTYKPSDFILSITNRSSAEER